MDKLKIKHNHKLTDILKVCIFSIVMMAPLFAIATKSLYVICNKNAYQSYSKTTKAETTILIPGQNVETGQLYTISYIGGLTTGQRFDVEEGNTNIVQLYFTNESWIVDYFTPYYDGNRTRLIVFDTYGNQHNKFEWQETANQFYFYSENTQQLLTTQTYYNLAITTYKQSSLDNVFYDAVEEINKEATFNWTTNTGIYTTINAMFVGLEMPNNNALAIMLTYWMICMLIYLVIDIIVALITKLTHLFNE